jgi:hypothetical protein
VHACVLVRGVCMLCAWCVSVLCAGVCMCACMGVYRCMGVCMVCCVLCACSMCVCVCVLHVCVRVCVVCFFSFDFEKKSNDFDQHTSPRLQVTDN